MKFGIIVNEKSGSVPEGGQLLLEEAIRELGHEIAFSGKGPCPEDFGEWAVAASEAGADVICVWGGDGTIAAVLQQAGADLPILVLPGGTMNMLPKRLHDSQLDWRKVLAAVLANPQAQWISAGEVAGRRFYVAAIFGQLTKLGESREAAREGELLEAVEILASPDIFDIETDLQVEVELADGTREFPATAAAVLPSETGGLELAVIAPDSHLDLAAAAMDAMVRGWREGAHFHADNATRIRFEQAKGKGISSTVDGEPCVPGAFLEVRYIPKAARVLVAGPAG